MSKSFMSINMGVHKKSRKKRGSAPTTPVYACRILPLRIALLGYDTIIALPLIRELDNSMSIRDLLRKRNRLLIELLEEKLHGDR